MTTPTETSASGGYEPLHEVAMVAVNWLCKSQAPLVRAQTSDLVEMLRAVPDEELGDALTSLTRVAGYFHTRLNEPAVAAQLLEICYELAPELQGAANRLTEKAWAKGLERARALKRVTSADPDEPRRAPQVGDKPALSVDALRPRTKFS